MCNTTVRAGTTAAPTNVFSRFIGIIAAPRATYEGVVARPAWLGMYLLTTVIVAFRRGPRSGDRLLYEQVRVRFSFC